MDSRLDQGKCPSHCQPMSGSAQNLSDRIKFSSAGLPITPWKVGNKPHRPFVAAIVTVPSSLELLTHRLDLLRADRAAAMTATLRDVTGDVADRATNVEASIRLQLLDERIALLELEIDQIRRHRRSDGVVSVGDAVRVDLGDGPEDYVVG